MYALFPFLSSLKIFGEGVARSGCGVNEEFVEGAVKFRRARHIQDYPMRSLRLYPADSELGGNSEHDDFFVSYPYPLCRKRVRVLWQR